MEVSGQSHASGRFTPEEIGHGAHKEEAGLALETVWAL
jgi:hypothetical protein